MIARLKELPDPSAMIRYISHLINCQYKWMARVTGDPAAQQLDWWEPQYAIDQLETEWSKSLQPWLDYITANTETQLMTEVQFVGFDGSLFAATPADIALQLNYHSIHHRAQMQTMLREQGVPPGFIDYIGTRYRRVNH